MDGIQIDFGGHASWIDAAQLITAIFSIAIAAWAVWYSNREARRNQTRTELTLSPAIVLIRTVNREQTVLGLLIKNTGNGPAIIDKAHFVYRKIVIDIGTGKTWAGDLSEKLKSLYVDDYNNMLSMPFSPAGISPGAVIGANQDCWVVATKREKLSDAALATFQNFISNSAVIVFYHSVHGRRFNSVAAYNPDGNISDVATEDWMNKWVETRS